MNGVSVPEKTWIAVQRLKEHGREVSFQSIRDEARRAGYRLSQTSIWRNTEARAIYLANRTWRPGPRKKIRGYFRDVSDAELQVARGWMAHRKIRVVAEILSLRAELSFLRTELAAYRAMERRGDIVPPREPVNSDRQIAELHGLLVRCREFMVGYRPALLREIEQGGAGDETPRPC